MNRKIKLLSIILVAIAIISLFIFLIFCDKTNKNGNTMSKQSEEEIVNHILNMQAYEAEITVEIESNKNQNRYILKQSLKQGNYERQEVLEPSNVAGIITEYQNGSLKITNQKLGLSTLYENYPYLTSNDLWLNSFVADYQTYDNRKSSEENEQIILEVKNEVQNKYSVYKKLYIDKATGNPTKLMVQDVNQKTIIYISYTKIEIS